MFRLVVTGLLLSASFVAVASVMSTSASSARLDAVIADDHRLDLFANALRQSGMDTGRNGSWTVFIPTDDAMRNEGSDFLLGSVLLTPSNADRLDDVIGHHMIRGQKLQLSSFDSRDTLVSGAGNPLTIERIGNGLRIDGHAMVLDAIETSSGMIYLVDRMLWPETWEGDTLAGASDS